MIEFVLLLSELPPKPINKDEPKAVYSNVGKGCVFSGQLCKYARRSGIMASALDFASRGLGLRLGWVSVFVLRQNTLVSACLSPPRSIKRYW